MVLLTSSHHFKGRFAKLEKGEVEQGGKDRNVDVGGYKRRGGGGHFPDTAFNVHNEG